MTAEYIFKPSDKEIIRFLASKGYGTQYDMAHGKDSVAAESTVWERIKNLEELGFIYIQRIEDFPRIKGNKKKYFGLTFKGLVAAIKLGMRLSQIQNREELVTKWVRQIEDVAAETKISQFFGITDLKKDKRVEKYRVGLINSVKEGSPELEEFLRHYDLNFSEDVLIFDEWLWHVAQHIAGGATSA